MSACTVVSASLCSRSCHSNTILQKNARGWWVFTLKIGMCGLIRNCFLNIHMYTQKSKDFLCILDPICRNRRIFCMGWDAKLGELQIKIQPLKVKIKPLKWKSVGCRVTWLRRFLVSWPVAPKINVWSSWFKCTMWGKIFKWYGENDIFTILWKKLKLLPTSL